jgi:hypothetical protein
MTQILIMPWRGKHSLETEALIADHRSLALYAGPVRDCTWGRWLWTADVLTPEGGVKQQPVGMGVAYSAEEATAAAEFAAHEWFGRWKLLQQHDNQKGH